MNAKTARNAIKILKALRLIVVHERAGQSSEIEPTHEDDWAPADQVEKIRNRVLSTPTKLGRGTKSGTTKSGRGTPTKSGSTPLPNQGGVPLPNQVDEGTPLKVLPEGTPLKEREREEFSSPFLENDFETQEGEYAEETYPDHSDHAAYLVKARNAVEGKNSAPVAIDFDAWIQDYLRYKPDKWFPLLMLTPNDARRVRSAVERVGSDARARELFVLALSLIRVDADQSWYRDRAFHFASLLDPQKMQFLALGALAEKKGLDPGVPVSSELSAYERIQARKRR
jgi:hypothetical protein